jgi:prevent-host-death family protein
MEDAMAQWQTADAKQKFSKLVEAAETDGPQVIMRHKDPVAVVLSADAYRTLVREADAKFAFALMNSPFEPADLSGLKVSLRADGRGEEDRTDAEDVSLTQTAG